jgi:hypothetical protein
MKYDPSKLDEMVMALLYISSFQDGRVWKGYDWNILERLHEKGLITNPVGKSKSFFLTTEGMKLGEQLSLKLSED